MLHGMGISFNSLEYGIVRVPMVGFLLSHRSLERFPPLGEKQFRPSPLLQFGLAPRSWVIRWMLKVPA